jgi:hypothetical protein
LVELEQATAATNNNPAEKRVKKKDLFRIRLRGWCPAAPRETAYQIFAFGTRLLSSSFWKGLVETVGASG